MDVVTPVESTRHGLRAKAPQMLAGAAHAPSHLPTSLPRPYIPPHRAQLPPARAGRGIRGAHDLSRARGDAGGALREAPLSAPAGSSRTASVTLPVLPLPLPSPHAFAILHTFIGEELTHTTLLATLASPPALHALACNLCASSNSLSTLMGHAGHVKELRQDMVALGV
ncbi:hypothetical protein DFH09DRAFT_1363765 [Mycena vulgaris]|nr:hypothetical protein DFH09DRAFT_1363765 [Mycena vulgaris]